MHRHFSGAAVFQRILQGACLRLNALRLLIHALLNGARSILDLVPELAQFCRIHFALKVCLDARHIALKASEQESGRARHLGKPLRADHHQRNHANDDKFGKPDIEHSGGSGLVH